MRRLPPRLQLSLRFQLILLLSLGLTLVFALTSVSTWRHDSASVRTEIESSLRTSEQAVSNAIVHLPADEQRLFLEQMVASFDGNRHVQAALMDENDRAVLRSSIAPPLEVPHWFRRRLDITAGMWRIALPPEVSPYKAIMLVTSPDNEEAEAWASFRDDLVTVASLYLVTLLLVWVIVGWGLRPLRGLSTGLAKVAGGDYRITLPLIGPSELSSLAAAFNRMATELGEMDRKNRRLQHQLTTIQEEERADLARDLHDEVGPYLFAVNVDAAAIDYAVGGTGEIAERTRSIKEAVEHVQRHVRTILMRLRPANLTDIDLRQALHELATFWQRQHPDILIAIAMDDVSFGAARDDVIFRIVQESLSNAVRHGKAHQIDVILSEHEGSIALSISDDGIGISARDIDLAFGSRMGLGGMRERATAAGGTFEVLKRPARGTEISVRLPVSGAEARMEAAQ